MNKPTNRKSIDDLFKQAEKEFEKAFGKKDWDFE